MDISSKIAQGLLSIGAVFLRPQEPFIWASGIKSPIYCDNRLILTAPAVRDTVERAIADTVRREFPQAEVLMGTATAGIAHAAIPRICSACLWAMYARAARTTAEKIRSRAGSRRGRGSS